MDLIGDAGPDEDRLRRRPGRRQQAGVPTCLRQAGLPVGPSRNGTQQADGGGDVRLLALELVSRLLLLLALSGLIPKPASAGFAPPPRQRRRVLDPAFQAGVVGDDTRLLHPSSSARFSGLTRLSKALRPGAASKRDEAR